MLSTPEPRAGRFFRPPALVPLAGLLLGLAGCGWLYNYESQMATEQQRIARFDEENDYLDAPLDLRDMPKAKDPSDKKGQKELDLPSTFFRPPLGIQSKPEKGSGPEPFLHYVRDSKRVATKNAERLAYSDVYVWAVPEEGISPKSFQDKAYSAFRAQLEGASPEAVLEHPLGREQLRFSPAYRKGAGGLSLFLGQRNGLNVALAFKLQDNKTPPKINRVGPDGTPVSLTATDLSLESLGVGKEAVVLQKTYDLRRGHR